MALANSLKAALVVLAIATMALARPAVAQEPLAFPGDEGEGGSFEQIILQITAERMVLNDFAYGLAMPGTQRAYIALGDLFDAAGFKAEISPVDQHVSGFLFDEANTLEIAPEEGTVQLADRLLLLQPGDIVVHDGAPYARIDAAERWLGVELDFNPNRLSVNIVSPRILPSIATARRAARGEVGDGQQDVDTSSYDWIAPQYRALSVPLVDASLTLGYFDSSASATGSLFASGQLGWMDTLLSLSGNDRDPVSQINLVMGRSNDAGLFGTPLRSFSLGDVIATPVTLVNSAGRGRGVELSTFPALRPTTYDTVLIEGLSQAGYDVELYRDGQLIDFQRVGADGRYSFADVLLEYGDNAFEIVSLGPQGQRRAEQRRYNVGSALTRPGQLNLAFSVQEADRDLFLVRDQPSYGRMRLAAQAEYGVMRGVSLQAGFARTPTRNTSDAEVRSYYSAGVAASLGNALYRIDGALDDTGGRALEGGLTGRLAGFTVNASHARYWRGYESPSEGAAASALDSATRLGLSRSVSVPGVDQSVAFTLRYEDLDLANGRDRETVTLRASSRLAGLSVRSDTSVQHNADQPTRWRQGLGISGRLGRLSLRGDYTHQLAPISEPYQFTLNADYRITPRSSANFRLIRQINPVVSTSGSLGVNWTFDSLVLGGSLGYSDQAGTFANLSLSLGFGVAGLGGPGAQPFVTSQRFSGTSLVEAMQFYDNDLDGVWSAADELVEEPGLYVEGRRARPVWSSAGHVLVQVPTHREAAVTLDEGGLNTPFARSVADGYKLVARPGQIQRLAIPIVPTGEVMGQVYYVDEEGARRPAARLRVKLVDTESGRVFDLTSDQDGVLYSASIIPGKYRVEPDQEQLDLLGLRLAEAPAQIHLSGEQGFLEMQPIIVAPQTP